VPSLLKGMLMALQSAPGLGLPIEPPESGLLQPYYRRRFSDAIISTYAPRVSRFSKRGVLLGWCSVWSGWETASIRSRSVFFRQVSPCRFVELIEQYRP
jgi:hypothetical protein